MIFTTVQNKYLMKYSDYQSQYRSDRIIIDDALNIDKLGWKNGDYFKVVNINGQVVLIKVDPFVSFVEGSPTPE